MRNMTNELLTTTEAARLLGCSASTVRRMIDLGALRGYRIPLSKHRRVAKSEVEQVKRTLQPTEA
jgi:excisionase family DNA binding protein